MTVVLRQPDLGINKLIESQELDPREAAIGSENILYTRGVLKTPFGFSKLDLTTTGLNSGDPVIFLGSFIELDKTSHTLAVTTQKIFKHNTVTEAWDDITGTTLSAKVGTPVSHTSIAHDDTTIFLNDDSLQAKAFYHCVLSDGGVGNIQRWAGKFEDNFADLVGAGGYHDGTTHRALHVGTFRNRLILLSSQDFASSSNTWTKNNQLIRWPTIGKLEIWTGTGSGFVSLIDTGGYNVWSALLGSTYYVYQNNSIWDLRYVGGTTVFDPTPVVKDIGLLSAHLIVTTNNIHYFVGSDYNVYRYFGGTVKEPIGDKVRDLLEEEISGAGASKSWMVLGANKKRLWIFIVLPGFTYATKAYGLDLRTGAWQVRDFSNRYTTTVGITSATLSGSSSFITGESYQQALDDLAPQDISNGDTTAPRYGDVLSDTSRTISVDATEVSWCKGGLEFFSSCSDITWSVDFTKGDILKVVDGSKYTNTRSGTHYYTIEKALSLCVFLEPKDPSLAVSDNTEVPADVSWFVNTDSGPTYTQVLETIFEKDRILIGDSSGFVYQYDSTGVTEDGENIVSRHLTPVFDWNEPGKVKRWAGLWISAKEKTSGNGKFVLSYRTDNFDTSETSWTDFTARDLTATYQRHAFRINRKSQEIQYKITNTSGSDFEIQNYALREPVELVDRAG